MKKVLKYFGKVPIVLGGWGLLMLIGFLLQYIFITSFRIPTDSMQPTLQPGDNILVNKWTMGARIFDVWEVAEGKETEMHR